MPSMSRAFDASIPRPFLTKEFNESLELPLCSQSVGRQRPGAMRSRRVSLSGWARRTPMNGPKTVLGIAFCPFFAVAAFAVGMLMAMTHLLALPALYIWERYLENHPSPFKASTGQLQRSAPAAKVVPSLSAISTSEGGSPAQTMAPTSAVVDA